ncbi:MAG: hypothetical protein AAB116_24610 [Candidatus Poribacteria bacterium]
MSKTITISEDIYRILEENAQDKGISLDALAERLISKSIEKSTKSWYQSFREKMIEENPELANRTREDVLNEFEKLSDMIAQSIHFESLDDMERFMRREEFDPRRF